MSVRDIFYDHIGRRIDKWEHYFEIYDRHLLRYVRQRPRVLEIGVDHGGSLQLWARYFEYGAEIHGLDINPKCSEREKEGFIIHIMAQDSPRICQLGTFDIIIDDGSHVLRDQQETFRLMWPQCRGTYIIEDCHFNQTPIDWRPDNALRYDYPQVQVFERPKRVITGEPSWPLREDEKAATELYHIRK